MSMQNNPGVSTTPSMAERSAANTQAASPGDVAAVLDGKAPTPLRAMLNHSRRVEYAPHDVLYHQGCANQNVIFITSGLLKLIIHLPNGRARIVRLHRPGAVLGLEGLLGRNNDHTAVALTPVTALRLPLSALQCLRKEEPETYIGLTERWHDYLRDADIWITQFSTGPIRSRVARLLSFLADFNYESADNQLQLLTCEEMGSVLGVTTESTSRILAEFKRKHILVAHDDQPDELYNADLGRLHYIAEQA